MDDPVEILHVEPTPEFAAETREHFDQVDGNVRVRTVSGATAALDELCTSRIDCVISDYEIPDSDGLELLQRVREEFPDLPFIIFTGAGSEAVASKALTGGATDYISKGDDTEQFDLLANRVLNAVERYRATRRAAAEERVSRVVRAVDRALVRADSEADIEGDCCEILSDADPYTFAWIGGVDEETGRIEPRAWGGGADEYLESITITADETPTGNGPAGRAVRTGTLAVSQNIHDDEAFEPWREAATEYGFQSVAAIPLHYESRRYGLLVVYADRSHAFDEAERDLLTDLGDDIAHAIHSRTIRSELRRTTARMEALFADAPDMITVHDTDGTLVDANRTTREQLGYTSEELDGMSVWEVDAEMDPAAARAFWDRMDNGSRHELETQFRRADGSTFPVAVHLRKTNVNGDTQFVVNSRDITARKERERRLETRSEALTAAIDGMAILDTDDRYVFVNPAHAEMYGYDDPDALLGESWRLCYGPDEEARFEREVFPELAEHREWFGEATGLRADGETFPQEVSLTRLDNGYLICVVRDVTERRTYLRNLEAIQRRTQALMETETVAETAQVAVETAQDILDAELSGFHVLDEADGRLRLLTETEPIGRTFEPLPGYHRRDDDPVSAVVWEAFDAGDPLYIPDTADHDRLAGNTPARSGVIQPIADHGVFIVSSTRPDAFDETDRALVDLLTSTLTVALRRVDRESLLQERERELTRQNERLEEFASVVSHDLRNPLEVVSGSLELAAQTGEEEHFDRGRRAVGRMEQLIDDLLSLAREGHPVGEMDKVDLGTVAERCWTTVATDEARLQVAESVELTASESRLKQLLENLFRNSVEHGSTGNRTGSDDSVEHGSTGSRPVGDDSVEHGEEGVTITVGALPSESGFYVADDGPGIPPDEREAVFESGYSTATEGTGFGLAIVDRIASVHGWDLSLAESDDGGVRFEVVTDPSA
ncbi:PAS domain S-box protein [Haloarcula pelagica]|uniref:PAS domain S-box protein n=1 Tax=Haloarcula pelagica TaxID=3033389 RepID=UPI0024C38D37|nr:PAS domain S-box protein [Halomicroarcula sp. YJ-61-S]